MHWPPRRGDRVIIASRSEDGKQWRGTITAVYRDWSYKPEYEGEVVITFIAGEPITGSPNWQLCYMGHHIWDARPDTKDCWNDGNFAYVNLDHSTPNQSSNEYETLAFWQLENSWSDEDGGCWSI